jgi:hypothetical protein
MVTIMEKIIKRYAVVQEDLVTNLVLADDQFAYSMGYILIPEPTIADPTPPAVDIGWQWTGFRFLPPPRNIQAEWDVIVAQAHQALMLSDSFVMPDLWATYSLEQQQAWTQYRQELRTIQDRFDDPANVVWPVTPLEKS